MSAYQTHRQAVIAELMADGVGDAAASALVREWEFEANRRGTDVRDGRFWSDARRWMADRRNAHLDASEDTNVQPREV